MSIRDSYGPGCREWDTAVIDEAQRIKNPESDMSIAIKRVKRGRAWALTRTPLENRLDDLVSILDFVAPGRFAPGTMAVGLRTLLDEVNSVADAPTCSPICRRSWRVWSNWNSPTDKEPRIGGRMSRGCCG